jgi:imidazoleglycerol-phosphate dehydratase
MSAAGQRKATVERQTAETKVTVDLDLGATGGVRRTGVGFLDHMLDHVATHGRFALTVQAAGDTQVDNHHTVEDVGICLGDALTEALGEKAGIRRFGEASVPMEDALAQVAVDLSGRSALVYNVKFPSRKIGTFDVELIREFMNALATHCGCNLHVNVPYGINSHHIAEAIFKALGRALHGAVATDGGHEVPSTKGVL